jgi:hypothetical protein
VHLITKVFMHSTEDFYDISDMPASATLRGSNTRIPEEFSIVRRPSCFRHGALSSWVMQLGAGRSALAIGGLITLSSVYR